MKTLLQPRGIRRPESRIARAETAMQNRWRGLAALAAVAGLLASCASGHHAPFSLALAPVRDLATVETRLQNAAANSTRVSLDKLGPVSYGGFSAPLWVVTVRPSGPADFHVLLIGGLHGNEPAGTESLLQFIKAVSAGTEQNARAQIDIIPLVNPWGWVHDTRFNQIGRDINRDFTSYTSQEARVVRDFARGKRYDLISDHHEDPGSKGFYLYQYGMRSTTLSRAIIDAQREHGYPIAQDVTMVVLRTKEGLIDVPYAGLWYMGLTRQLSMTNYFRLHNARRVYTVETPGGLPMDERLRMHRTALDMLLESVGEHGRTRTDTDEHGPARP
jgi:hypothetical protein